MNPAEQSLALSLLTQSKYSLLSIIYGNGRELDERRKKVHTDEFKSEYQSVFRRPGFVSHTGKFFVKQRGLFFLSAGVS